MLYSPLSSFSFCLHKLVYFLILLLKVHRGREDLKKKKNKILRKLNQFFVILIIKTNFPNAFTTKKPSRKSNKQNAERNPNSLILLLLKNKTNTYSLFQFSENAFLEVSYYRFHLFSMYDLSKSKWILTRQKQSTSNKLRRKQIIHRQSKWDLIYSSKHILTQSTF